MQSTWEDIKETTSETASNIKDKITDNEKLMDTFEGVKDKTLAGAKTIKDKTTEFMHREDVQENIEKAKATTVDITKKSVKAIKGLFSKKEDADHGESN